MKRRLAVIAVPVLLIGALAALTCIRAARGRLNQQLVDAVGANDVARVSLLLDRGADPNVTPRVPPSSAWARLLESLLGRGGGPTASQKGPRGRALLGSAAAHNRWSVVEDLLRHGAEPNARSDSGDTALMCAARAGSLASAKALVEHGADVNAHDAQGFTPLWFASAYHSTRRGFAVALLLLEHGADPNVRARGPESRLTPLLCAVLTQDPAVIRPFIQHGADPTVPLVLPRGVGPAHCAARRPAVRRMLLEAEAEWRRRHPLARG